MNTAVPQPITRADIAAWMFAAVALGLIIELHLLSGLLAGLLVFKLVDVLTPWFGCARSAAMVRACWPSC